MLKFKYYKVPTLDGFPSRRKESVSNLVKWRVGFQPVFFINWSISLILMKKQSFYRLLQNVKWRDRRRGALTVVKPEMMLEKT
jgi:hypothetical protein